jgi:hypothetical protein
MGTGPNDFVNSIFCRDVVLLEFLKRGERFAALIPEMWGLKRNKAGRRALFHFYSIRLTRARVDNLVMIN